MSQGYVWIHWVKLVPDDGVDEVLALRALLTDAAGPTRTGLENVHDKDTRQDINKIDRQHSFGVKQKVSLRCEILEMADHATLVKIANAALDNGTTIFLSLDAGLTYKEVIVTKLPSPRSIRNITAVGAIFDLRFQTVHLQDEMVAIEDGW